MNPLDICVILRTIRVAFVHLLLTLLTHLTPDPSALPALAPAAVSYRSQTISMSYYQVQPCETEEFPREDYSALRRGQNAPTEVIIPYKPVEEPAWDRHCNSLPPKPARFKKLNRWDSHRTNINTVVKWAVLAAGTASVATPVLMQLPH